MSNKSTGFFSNWGTLEYALLGIVMLLLCGVAAIAIFVIGEVAFLRSTVTEDATTPAQDQAATGDQATESDGVSLDTPTEPAVQAADAAAALSAGDTQAVVTLSTPASAPGTTVTVQGEGWPAGSRVIISLVPSEPPNYTVNSALVDGSGRFSVEMIVPSDTRWLEESPVPVLVTTDAGLSAQSSLTIVAPPDSQPVATPAASTKVIVVAAVVEPDQPSLPKAVPQLTTTANLNVRAGPGTNYPVLGVLTLGQQVEIIGRNENATWWQIKFPGANSDFGWVSAEFAQASNIGNVPIVKAPAVPAQPTPAPTPTPEPGLVITDWRGEY